MRLRFTIRDLLWLTLVVALAVGWWIDRRAIQRQSAVELNALRHELIKVLVPPTASFGNSVPPQATGSSGYPLPMLPPPKPVP